MYKRKTVPKWHYDALKLAFLFFLLSLVPNIIVKAVEVEFVSPLPDPYVIERVETKTVVVEQETIDTWVNDAIVYYFPNDPTKQSEVKMIMHCLLHRETKHGYSKAHGDSGAAGGPLQFHNPTWEGYRKIMIAKGEADKISSRYDMKDAIYTTVWAIKDGRASAWGPINRKLNGSDYASCPVPSWY